MSTVRITEAEYDDFFNTLWQRTEKQFFKYESFQTYNEEPEREMFALFRSGHISELRDLLVQDVRRENSMWRDAERKGISFHRVRVYNLPLNEYLKFEIEAYKIQADAGEIIRMVLFEHLQQRGIDRIKDFMLFDDEEALIPDYDAYNRLIGAFYSKEDDDVSSLHTIQKLLATVSIPLSDFLKHFSL